MPVAWGRSMLRPYRITHVAAQHPGESACGPRMACAVLPVCIARDDGEWTGYRHNDHLLRIRMDHDGTAGPAIALKARPIQPLACRRPLQLGQPLIGSVFVNVLDSGRLNRPSFRRHRDTLPSSGHDRELAH